MRLAVIDRGELGGGILQQFDHHAAHPHHHHRPESRVQLAADDNFDAGRDHRLHQHAGDARCWRDAPRRRHDFGKSAANRVRVAESEAHDAGFGLVRNIRRFDFQHHRIAAGLGGLLRLRFGLHHRIGHHRDAIGGEDLFRFAFRQLGAGCGQKLSRLGSGLVGRPAAQARLWLAGRAGMGMPGGKHAKHRFG